MKNGISDGAIVQHLAKLRTRMVEAGLEVPPPLRRGGTTMPSKMGGGTSRPLRNSKVKKEPKDDYDDEQGSEEEETYRRESGRGRKEKLRKHKHKSMRSKVSDDDDDSDEESSPSSDSDSEDGDEYTAVGAPWLEYPNDKAPVSDEEERQETAEPAPKPTKIVKLRLPNAYGETRQGSDIDGNRPEVESAQPEEQASEMSGGYQGAYYPPTTHQTLNQPINMEAGSVHPMVSQLNEQENAQYTNWAANHMESQAGQTQYVVAHIPQNHITTLPLIQPAENNAHASQLLEQPQVTYTTMHTVNPYPSGEPPNMVGHEPEQGMAPWMDDGQSEPRHPDVAFMDDMGHEFFRDDIFDETIDQESANLFGLSGN